MPAELEDISSFKAEERALFCAALDELPHVDSPVPVTDRYEIEDEDWQWLTEAVSNKSTAEAVNFAQSEYDRLQEAPELVRLSLHAPLPIFSSDPSSYGLQGVAHTCCVRMRYALPRHTPNRALTHGTLTLAPFQMQRD